MNYFPACWKSDDGIQLKPFQWFSVCLHTLSCNTGTPIDGAVGLRWNERKKGRWRRKGGGGEGGDFRNI